MFATDHIYTPSIQNNIPGVSGDEIRRGQQSHWNMLVYNLLKFLKLPKVHFPLPLQPRGSQLCSKDWALEPSSTSRKFSKNTSKAEAKRSDFRDLGCGDLSCAKHSAARGLPWNRYSTKPSAKQNHEQERIGRTLRLLEIGKLSKSSSFRRSLLSLATCFTLSAPVLLSVR